MSPSWRGVGVGSEVRSCEAGIDGTDTRSSMERTRDERHESKTGGGGNVAGRETPRNKQTANDFRWLAAGRFYSAGNWGRCLCGETSLPNYILRPFYIHFTSHEDSPRTLSENVSVLAR